MLYLFKNAENFVGGRITTSYMIDILSKENGKKVFESYKDVSNYNDREIEVRSKFRVKTRVNNMKKREMKDMYIENIMDFTNDEKATITNSVNYLFSHFKSKVPLISNWKFIKLNSDVDWGYPFTIEDYIVLPSDKIPLNEKEFAKTLFHEQLHIIQRKEPLIFKEYFEKQWKMIPYDLPNDEWINKYLVRNPDSDDFYLYKLTDELYVLPLPTTFDVHHNFVEVAMFLNQDKKILAKGEEPYVVPLRQVVDYVTRFYNVGSLYHPNEIFATMLSQMLFNNLSISEIDQTGIDALFKLLYKYF
jgi:hypothetical protein